MTKSRGVLAGGFIKQLIVYGFFHKKKNGTHLYQKTCFFLENKSVPFFIQICAKKKNSKEKWCTVEKYIENQRFFFYVKKKVVVLSPKIIKSFFFILLQPKRLKMHVLLQNKSKSLKKLFILIVLFLCSRLKMEILVVDKLLMKTLEVKILTKKIMDWNPYTTENKDWFFFN